MKLSLCGLYTLEEYRVISICYRIQDAGQDCNKAIWAGTKPMFLYWCFCKKCCNFFQWTHWTVGHPMFCVQLLRSPVNQMTPLVACPYVGKKESRQMCMCETSLFALHCLSTLRTPWWTDLNSSWTLNYLLDDLLSVNNRAAGKLNRQVFMYLCNYISFIPAMNLLCMWLNDLPIKQYCRIWRSKTECSKRQNTFSAWWTVCNSLEK